MTKSRLVSNSELLSAEAKWITLRKLTYLDTQGQEVEYITSIEVACLTPLSASMGDFEIDAGMGIKPANILFLVAVAVLAILRSKTHAFSPSIVIIEQYRPPVDKIVIGLIDEGETPEQAAVRELEEETGYKADSIVQSSPVIVSDPGMTNANMKLVVLDVNLPDGMEYPKQKLESGEFITTRVVELADLDNVLKGAVFPSH
ncbi:hypothetical protein H0H81_009103 [Sphagnurus paluster]|uniref:Nudix hydrolase domain-containing protein n=1 Tax=Sphagnurus paluster TaxID=117069 RepID=A0A9P7FPK5_9AGAR|nr:hypothetical protein H0H81_009103 [Sphagnurus paluster]